MKLGLGGYYVFHKNGVKVGQTANLLTDSFYSRWLGSINALAPEVGYKCRFHLGTGTTEPVPADTGMETFITGTTSGELDNSGSSSASQNMDANRTYTEGGRYKNFYSWTTTYSAGTFSGQAVSEVGARFYHPTLGVQNKTSPTVIDSHALIKDGSGNVAPITLSVTDTLTVTYVLVYEIPYDEKSTIQYEGNSYEVTFTANEAAVSFESAAPRWSLLNLPTNSTVAFFLGLPNTSSFTYNFATKLTGVQTPDTPNTDIPSIATTTSELTSKTVNTTTKTVTAVRTVAVTTGEMSTGIGKIRFGAGGSSNSPLMSVHFDPPLTGSAITLLTFTFVFQFGEVSLTGEELPLTGYISPSANLIESLPTGLQTTVGKARVVPFGGVEPYTYSWAYVSGGSALLSADSSTSATTTFTGTGTAQQSIELWRCTITDSSAVPKTLALDKTIDVTWA